MGRGGRLVGVLFDLFLVTFHPAEAKPPSCYMSACAALGPVVLQVFFGFFLHPGCFVFGELKRGIP